MMPPLLLLDLDGTLVDTLGFIIECFRRSVRPLVKRLPTDEEVVATFGPSETECIARLLSRYERESLLRDHLQAEHIHQSADRFHHLYHDGYASGHVQLYPGMREVLDAAKARGWSLGIFTGKGRKTAQETLEHLKLCPYFEVVVTSDDVARPKPAPDGVRLAAWHVATTPEKTWFVGDNPADILAGNEAGATSIAAMWGAFDPQATKSSKPNYVLDSPHQLETLLNTSTL